jgi:hypothetical protein
MYGTSWAQRRLNSVMPARTALAGGIAAKLW